MREFLDTLPARDAAEIAAAMMQVRERGTFAARHLRGDIWEVRVTGENRAFRILFSIEGRLGQVLLALEGFTKKTQRTPPATLELAEARLADWRGRGRAKPPGTPS